MLPRRIAVVGVSASGKSWFGRELAAKTGLPLTHIDAIMWQPGWDYIGDEATVKKLKEASSQDSWIIEGYIDKEAFESVLGRADQIIYLDYSRHVAAGRYIVRWWNHRKHPRPELEGSPDRFSFKFLKTVWSKREVYYLEKFLKQMPESSKVLRLKTPRQARALIKSN